MLEKNYSKKFQKIHREAPVLESLFNKYTRLKPISLSKNLFIYFLLCLCSLNVLYCSIHVIQKI